MNFCFNSKMPLKEIMELSIEDFEVTRRCWDNWVIEREDAQNAESNKN